MAKKRCSQCVTEKRIAMRTPVEANHVGVLTYRSRDIGYGVEKGKHVGYFTGEVDTWGKQTFIPVRSGQTLYLFADEIIEWSPHN